ncbi:type IV pilus assembly protein PilO [Lysinibacillus parviboronicapiens]|uniref:Type IV pilus assembly protein PilO n=1 Tax=Lysinibacillus parviboronicapiens TaxID=436516 RepID=A0ABV2PDM7_9BACI
MNKLTSSKNSSILLLVALTVALLFALYYYLLLPKLDEVEAKASNVNQLQQQITEIEGQLTKLDEVQGELVNILTLRQKVPETRAIEKIILDMAEIEEVSGTRLESLNFNNYDTAVAQSEVTEPNMVEKAQAEVNGEQTEADENLPVSSIAKETLPAELKLVTFSVEVAALDFTALDSFLKEVEKLERVMKTDTISFSLPGEQDQLDEDADLTLQATVQVTTFYYEGQQ